MSEPTQITEWYYRPSEDDTKSALRIDRYESKIKPVVESNGLTQYKQCQYYINKRRCNNILMHNNGTFGYIEKYLSNISGGHTMKRIENIYDMDEYDGIYSDSGGFMCSLHTPNRILEMEERRMAKDKIKMEEKREAKEKKKMEEKREAKEKIKKMNIQKKISKDNKNIKQKRNDTIYRRMSVNSLISRISMM